MRKLLKKLAVVTISSLYALQVKELYLDNCRASTIEGLTDKYEDLEVLSMINIGLTSLKGFPAYPKLRSVRELIV